MASSTLGISVRKIISCAFVMAIAALGAFILSLVPKLPAAGIEWPFLLLTGIFGVFLIIAGLYMLYRLTWQDQQDARIAARYPDQPWMLNPQWAAGKLVDRPLGRIIILFVFLIGWNGGIGLVVSHNWPKIAFALQHLWHAWLLFAFFALLTATVFNLLIQSVRQGWRTGSAMLIPNTIPGRLGGSFAAQFRCRLSQDPPKRLNATLTCYRWAARDPSFWRPVDKNRMLWWREIEVSPRRAKGRLVAAVHFEVPDDLPESGIQPNLDDIVWMLRVDAGARTGDPLNFHWEVPIYAEGRGEPGSRSIPVPGHSDERPAPKFPGIELG